MLRRIENGTATTGEREIIDEEAVVIRRIFHDYAAGASPKQICKALDAEAIPGPQGAVWGRSEATEALRGLVDAIVLTPDQAGETIQIELRGNLAAMLRATVQTKRSPESDDLSLKVSLVAGARNHHYLQLWRLAS